jgi:uncharacterized HAD superfamily protein
MRYIIDIDGVISRKLKWSREDSYLRPEKMFMAIRPDKKVIAKINALYRAGHRIVLHTSRLWHDYEVTKAWLSKHEVLYSELIMAKPLGDFYIDDKNMSVGELLAL